MEALLGTLKTLNSSLSVLRTNPYLYGSINLFLVLYAGLAAPNLPASVAGLFEYPVFKLAILSLLMVFVQGQNWTTAILIAIGFTVSMMTLSRYRTFTLANELTGLGFGSSGNDQSWGPNGQVANGSTQESEWGAKAGVNRTKLRGFDYSVGNESNLLPGGHGDMEINKDKAIHEDGRFQGPQGPDGYESGMHASFGTPDSQL